MNITQFVICIENSDYPASLEKRKIYETIVDADAKKHGQIRVIDESGEDYLYPKEYFVDAGLPEEVRAAVVEAAELNHLRSGRAKQLHSSKFAGENERRRRV